MFLVMGTVDETGDFLPIVSISHQAGTVEAIQPYFAATCLAILRQQYRTVSSDKPHSVDIADMLERLPYYTGVILHNVEPVVEAFYLQQALEQQGGCLLKLWVTGEK